MSTETPPSIESGSFPSAPPSEPERSAHYVSWSFERPRKRAETTRFEVGVARELRRSEQAASGAAVALEGEPVPLLTIEAALAVIESNPASIDVADLRDALESLELGELDERELRARVAQRLVAIARYLRDDDRAATRPLLWSALRRVATLIPAEDAGFFAEFLRTLDDADTRQAALLSLQSVFFNRLPAEGIDASLVARVRTLFDTYLHPDILVDARMRALGANAAVTLSVLAPSDASNVAARVQSDGGPSVRALVASKWRDMLAQRQDAAAAPLVTALAILK